MDTKMSQLRFHEAIYRHHSNFEVLPSQGLSAHAISNAQAVDNLMNPPDWP